MIRRFVLCLVLCLCFSLPGVCDASDKTELRLDPGVYIGGIDIPLGYWKVICDTPDHRFAVIDWGTMIGDSGEFVKREGEYSAFNYVFSPNYPSYDGEAPLAYIFPVKENYYIGIEPGGAPAVFIPIDPPDSLFIR